MSSCITCMQVAQNELHFAEHACQIYHKVYFLTDRASIRAMHSSVHGKCGWGSKGAHIDSTCCNSFVAFSRNLQHTPLLTANQCEKTSMYLFLGYRYLIWEGFLGDMPNTTHIPVFRLLCMGKHHQKPQPVLRFYCAAPLNRFHTWVKVSNSATSRHAINQHQN